MQVPDIDLYHAAQTIDTIRLLSADAVEQANSGHPGTPMEGAPWHTCSTLGTCGITRQILIGPDATASSFHVDMAPCCCTAHCICAVTISASTI